MFILEILIIPFPENRVHVNDLSINIEYTLRLYSIYWRQSGAVLVANILNP